MKVCFFTYFFPRITETFILNKITNLLDRGVDVQILAIYDSRSHKAVEDREIESVVHGDVIKYRLIERVTYIPKVKGEFNYSEIQKQLVRIKPDIIHFQWSGLAEHVFKELSFDVPAVTNFHEFNMPSNWRQVKSFQDVYKNSNLILPVSDYLYNLIVKDGCPSDKVITHHMGVDIDRFIPVKTKPKNSIKFLTVASLLEKKGYEDSLKVISNLKNLGVEMEYVIVGDGILKDKLVKLVDEYGLRGAVRFLGKLTQEDTIRQYQSSDIFIQPSITAMDGSHEGIPTSLMEASACGLPVVSTFHSGIPELIKNNKSGYLSCEHDIINLTKSALDLAKNENIRHNFGREGRNLVTAEFNIKKLTSNVLDIYKNLSR